MEPEEHAAERQRYLTTYVQDHRAGAEAGVRLARRCHDHAPDPTTAAELARIVEEIEADRVSLAAIMDGLGVEASKVKDVAGLAAERIGRLKLNGRLVRTSPLSVVVELEGLIGAVSVKRELWATLSVLAGARAAPDERLATLLARADDQRSRLQAIHARVVTALFGSAPVSPAGEGAS
jgi:hypothetical protein